MRTARRLEAASIRAQGYKKAQIIRADADATAARVYAESFGKDAEFYSFYRAMQSYRRTFVENGEKGTANMVLSPSNEYLQEFRGRSEEHTSELQSLMRISYAVFCLKKK